MRQPREPVANPLSEDRAWRLLDGRSTPDVRELGAGRWVRIKQYPDRTAYRVAVEGACYFAKHYRPTGAPGRWRDFVFRFRPQRAYRAGLELIAFGVGTPRPIGVHGWGWPLLREVLLVNEWVPECEKWSAHLQERMPKRECPAAFERCVSEMGRLLGRLHRRHWYHGDLVANVLFGRRDAEFRPLLVDLEALRRRTSEDRYRKNLWELARTAQHISDLSVRDHWRFLSAYAEERGLSSQEVRGLWRTLEAAQRRRIEERNKDRLP